MHKCGLMWAGTWAASRGSWHPVKHPNNPSSRPQQHGEGHEDLGVAVPEHRGPHPNIHPFYKFETLEGCSCTLEVRNDTLLLIRATGGITEVHSIHGTHRAGMPAVAFNDGGTATLQWAEASTVAVGLRAIGQHARSKVDIPEPYGSSRQTRPRIGSSGQFN